MVASFRALVSEVGKKKVAKEKDLQQFSNPRVMHSAPCLSVEVRPVYNVLMSTSTRKSTPASSAFRPVYQQRFRIIKEGILCVVKGFIIIYLSIFIVLEEIATLFAGFALNSCLLFTIHTTSSGLLLSPL